MNIELLQQRIQSWAERRFDLQAVLVIGSLARGDGTADDWSDLDLCLFAADPSLYAADSSWFRSFGNVWMAALEFTTYRDPEWLVIYESGIKVDFAILPEDRTARSLAELMARSPHANTLSRGARALIDNLPIHDHTLPKPPTYRPPTQAQFESLVSGFWIDAHRAAKFIRRGDLWRAMTASQCDMRSRLLTLLEWHARTASGEAVDTWYGGRYLESWVHPRARQFLPLIHARYDADDMARALLVHVDLFRWVSHETARQLELTAPDDEQLHTWIQDTLHALSR